MGANQMNKIQRYQRQVLLNPEKHNTKSNKKRHRGKPNYKRNGFDTLYYWSREVRMQYDYHCVYCNASRHLSAHHIFQKSKYKGLKYNLNNGILLCNKCHVELHQLNDAIIMPVVPIL
jgi:5-methylcytosine-specific restriction endonuclease McrA